MIYIHRLSDLNPKSAEIESTLLIRDLKRKAAFPFKPELFQESFATFFMSDTDQEVISGSIKLIEPAIEELKSMMEKNDETYESINIKRAVDLLSELPEPMKKNILFADDISHWRGQLVFDLTETLNAILKLTKKEDMAAHNEKLNEIFKKILRNDQMFFNSQGLVNEANIEHTDALASSMENGFLFHVLLEEEIKKIKFSIIRNRLPKSELDRVDRLKARILEIKKGVDRAYEHNIRMVQLAVIIYSFIRMTTQK